MRLQGALFCEGSKVQGDRETGSGFKEFKVQDLGFRVRVYVGFRFRV